MVQRATIQFTEMKKASLQPFLKEPSASQSVLVGAPRGFDFNERLRDATRVRAAIAFGHMTGWNEIGAAIRDSAAKDISILLGQAFFQTEPDLLDALSALQCPQFHVKLAQIRSTFHPKVWVVDHPKSSFAIIGSANLSYGGLVSNTECSGYFDDPAIVKSASKWFEFIWDQSFDLDDDLLNSYRQGYLKTLKTRQKARNAILQASDALASAQPSWKKGRAVKSAKGYFSSSSGALAGKKRIEAMDKIRSCLKPPSFNFNKADWLEFLHIPEFGSMRRIRRDTAEKLPQIKKMFRYLYDNSIPMQTRIDTVVPNGSSFHVLGIGMNIATKVLAMRSNATMPVYNEAVEKALTSFGYRLESHGTDGARYVAFCKEMRSFVKECGLSEMLSIDAFFEDHFHAKD
jgi:HKD family nuclease